MAYSALWRENESGVHLFDIVLSSIYSTPLLYNCCLTADALEKKYYSLSNDKVHKLTVEMNSPNGINNVITF